MVWGRITSTAAGSRRASRRQAGAALRPAVGPCFREARAGPEEPCSRRPRAVGFAPGDRDHARPSVLSGRETQMPSPAERSKRGRAGLCRAGRRWTDAPAEARGRPGHPRPAARLRHDSPVSWARFETSVWFFVLILKTPGKIRATRKSRSICVQCLEGNGESERAVA